MKGSNDDNKDVTTGYNDHITDNRDIPFAKLDSMDNEITQSNLTEDIFKSLKGPRSVNQNVSHSNTPLVKELQRKNTRVSMSKVDVNQSRLIRQLSPSINPKHNNKKIQQNPSNTTRRTVFFNSSIRDNTLTKRLILRLPIAKVDPYGYEQELTPTFHSTERVITNNKENISSSKMKPT